jgi:hypothetical protein
VPIANCTSGFFGTGSEKVREVDSISLLLFEVDMYIASFSRDIIVSLYENSRYK